MSEFPEDIKKDAEEAVAGFMGWIEGGNTTASLSEHAVAGLKHSFAAAILAERERCKKKMIDISDDLRRQCESLVDKWSDGLGSTFESKAAGAASWIVSDAATSIDVEVAKLERGAA